MALYDIFISYSRKDFDEVDTFVKMLQKRIPQLSYWFDIKGIESGDEFTEKIISAIDNSSYVIFMFSDNSIASPWTKKEAMYAKNIGKKIVPVLLKHTSLKGWFLFEFGNIDCIDSANRLQVDKLIGNLCNWTGKIAASSALPMTETYYNNNDKESTATPKKMLNSEIPDEPQPRVTEILSSSKTKKEKIIELAKCGLTRSQVLGLQFVDPTYIYDTFRALKNADKNSTKVKPNKKRKNSKIPAELKPKVADILSSSTTKKEKIIELAKCGLTRSQVLGLQFVDPTYIYDTFRVLKNSDN